MYIILSLPDDNMHIHFEQKSLNSKSRADYRLKKMHLIEHLVMEQCPLDPLSPCLPQSIHTRSNKFTQWDK